MNKENAPVLTSKGDSVSKLIWVIPLATAVAALANVIFYYMVIEIFNFPMMFFDETRETLTDPLVRMPVFEVILFSGIFGTSAGLVFVLVTHVLGRPIRTYLIIAGTVLLLSFLLPLKIPTPPVAMEDKLSLVTMHVIGAIAVVGVLVGLGRKRK
jgi:hypothetical protein